MVTVGVLLLNLLQQPGRTTFDTKLDLQYGPGDLLSRSLSLWNGDWALGGLQNQASGYLFPMGPAFWLGDVLGVPAWVWERLWSAAVMLLAYEGARRLARSWPGIGAGGAVLAGAAYMLAPRVLTTVGGLSGETLPGAVLPWTVLPLVLYLRGRLRARTGILASVATIPVMGGQNATLVAACLVLPALLLALGEGRTWRRRLRDLVAWSVLVLVVTAWWLVPLLLLGGYAPPFLDFIESSRNTAAGTGWLASLRGTSHWVAFFPGGGSIGWEGGYRLAASRWLVLPTVLVAAAGLAGLALRRTWQRRVLVTGVLVGLAVLTAGSGTPAGSLLSGVWLDALDGVLAPLRNVHKWDPVVRLPLCLGLGALVGAVPASWSWRRLPRALPARRAVLALAALAVLAAALPAATGSLRTSDGAEDLSAGWRGASGFLSSQPGPVRAMVLPGAGFAVQVWGRTIDEPIQVLDAPPWLARAQVTVAPGGTLRLLDGVEESISRARAQPSLAAAFSRLGMTHVVLRHDLDLAQTDAPSPDVVEAGVAGTPGLNRVAGYGREAGGRHEVEVYAVTTVDDPRVSIVAADSVRRVSGGPEAVADLVAAGLLATRQPTVLVDADEDADVVTDTAQRVERSFGRVHATVSGVMSAQDRFRVERREHDFTDPDVPSARTTATYVGAQDVVASSSGGYADVLGPVRPEQHPYAAFDDSVFTSWVTAPLRDPTGQWIEVRFGSPVEVGPLGLTFDQSGAFVRSVRVTTDDGEVEAGVDVQGSARGVELPAGETTSLRITLSDVRGSGTQVRLADVSLGDREVRRSLRLPGRVGADTAVHLSAEQPRRACLQLARGLACEQSRQRVTPETPGFERTLQVEEAGTWQVAGRAVATNGGDLERLFAPLDPRRVAVSATSTYAGDPAVVGARAYDGRRDTGWYASPVDPAPALGLTWRGRRTISSVTAVLDPGQPGRLPPALLVDPLNGDDPQLVSTSGPDAGKLEPVRTDRLRVAASGGTGTEGVGISELAVEGLAGLRHRPDPDTPTGSACGFGPVVGAGGRTVATQVLGTLADVVAGRELEVRACEDATLDLDRGVQRLGVVNPAGFAVTDLWLRPPGWDTTSRAAGPDPTAAVGRWADTDRTVEVTAAEGALLSVPESRNAGWVATAGGRELTPVVVDGWKQGWRVPAGTEGEVRLSYAPQPTFVASIVVGLVLAGLVALAALALLVGASRAGTPQVVPTSADSRPEETGGDPRPDRWGGAVRATGLVVLLLVSVPLGAGAVLGRLTRRVPTPVAVAAGLAALALAALLVAVTARAVSPPVGSDLVTALVVGALAGRVLGGAQARGVPGDGAA